MIYIKPKWKNYSKDELQSIINESKSLAEIARNQATMLKQVILINIFTI